MRPSHLLHVLEEMRIFQVAGKAFGLVVDIDGQAVGGGELLLDERFQIDVRQRHMTQVPQTVRDCFFGDRNANNAKSGKPETVGDCARAVRDCGRAVADCFGGDGDCFVGVGDCGERVGGPRGWGRSTARVRSATGSIESASRTKHSTTVAVRLRTVSVRSGV